MLYYYFFVVETKKQQTAAHPLLRRWTTGWKAGGESDALWVNIQQKSGGSRGTKAEWKREGRRGSAPSGQPAVLQGASGSSFGLIWICKGQCWQSVSQLDIRVQITDP